MFVNNNKEPQGIIPVFEHPIIFAVVRAVSNESHGMVDVGTGAPE